MKINLYTIFDHKAEVFLPPFFVPTKALALRAFSDCVQSDTHTFGQHLADYTLFSLGQFDDSDASFELGDRQSLGNGVEFLSVTSPEITDVENQQPIQ